MKVLVIVIMLAMFTPTIKFMAKRAHRNYIKGMSLRHVSNIQGYIE